MWSYGEDCRYPCNKHCVNQTCDRFNGSCLSGCDRGYYGPKCDQGLKLLVCIYLFFHDQSEVIYLCIYFRGLLHIHISNSHWDKVDGIEFCILFWYQLCCVFRIRVTQGIRFMFINSSIRYSRSNCQCLCVFNNNSCDLFHKVRSEFGSESNIFFGWLK